MLTASEQAKYKEAVDALLFYYNPKNWRSRSTGFAAQYDPEPTEIEADGGRRAKEALKKLQEYKLCT
jgi:hypothetical protein